MMRLSPSPILNLCIAFLLMDAAYAQATGRRLILWTTSDWQRDPGLRGAIRKQVKHLSAPGFSAIDLNDEAELSASRSDLVVALRVTGTCNPNNDRTIARQPLGYVIMAEGVILPRIFVNCDAILQAIRPYVAGQPPLRQNTFLASAIVRVIEHELRHILEQTPRHLPTGVFKPYLQGSELIAQ